ncbi:MAG: zinc-binding alcohol dehydrogenase family protein [Ilumatobacter sp.]|uniref:quinone oxidoreductase family protein n=1 Tax=Ilumatobacter sp. TaxID=1967498 RepID=UPI0039188506
MKAVRITDWGAAPVVEELEDPPSAAGRTVVRVAAATVAHLDRTIWSGAFLRPPALPYTPGVEAAGVVVSSETFDVGARVWIRGGGLGVASDGTWAEYVSAPDEALGALPDDVSFGLGAVFFSPCTSAWIALHDIAALAAGELVVVTGATGAVGAVACQLAVEAGADVIATVSRPERLDLLPPGVTGVVVDGATESWAEALGDRAPDLLVDTVGGQPLATILPTVRSGGRAVLVGYVAGTTHELDLPAFMQRNVSLHPLNMVQREPAGRAVAPELLARLADGRLHLDVTEFGLDAAGEALAWLDESGHTGRAVLVPTTD